MLRKGFFAVVMIALLWNLYLDYRVYSQGRASDPTDIVMMTANFIDLGLLIGLTAFFIYEYEHNRRSQRALRRAMTHLNDMNESLKAAEAERSVFFKKTVHDLKNPLGTIRGFAELIGDDSESKSVSQMSQTIQRISDGTLALVNDLLAPSRRKNLAQNFQNLDLGECVAETCRFLEPMASVKEQKIVFDPPEESVQVLGDALMMRDVFFNLIGNAIKFSPRGATTRVHFGGSGNLVTVSVHDEGPGLTEDDLRKLYIPGQKLSAKATGGEASSGFGLYSVKETVEMHGGRLEAFNNGDGLGACFIVRLNRA